MILLFAPPYLQDTLRHAVSGHPAAAELIASGDLQVVSQLEYCLSGDIARAAVVTTTPERLRGWAYADGGVAAITRLVAASNALAGAAAAAALPSSLVVTETALRAAPSRELGDIVAFLVGEAGGWRAPAELETEPSSERVSAELAALGLYAKLPLQAGATARWPAAIFRSAERTFPGAIDITGPARNLIYGPYLCLPPGLWKATLEFELCADAAQYDYSIDFGVIDDFARCVARPSGAGVHVATLSYTVASPSPVELRLWLGRAAFHGELRLHGATLTYIAAGPAEEAL